MRKYFIIPSVSKLEPFFSIRGINTKRLNSIIAQMVNQLALDIIKKILIINEKNKIGRYKDKL